jgi:CheY-like chemotaxis protein
MTTQYKRIIFIDDDSFSNMDSCEFLRGYGFNVASGYNAAAVIGLLDRHKPLAALVTDIELGPGEDGFEIARRVRELYPHLPIVFISGADSARGRAQAVEDSCFIPKPYHPRQVAAALDQALNRVAA